MGKAVVGLVLVIFVYRIGRSDFRVYTQGFVIRGYAYSHGGILVLDII